MLYQTFVDKALQFIPRNRIFTDEVRRLAWGTDAGFYRLIPQVVINAKDEEEVSVLLRLASQMGLPVTFRAAGTSLSGQAITDSILIIAGKNWEKCQVNDDGETITIQPGVVGNRINEILKPYGRIFTPDPASKASAMAGGIIINNASGMNCGTHANSDKMMISMRIVLADGTIIDTANPTNNPREKEIYSQLAELRDEIRADQELVDRIRRKYSIKNVTGLNLRPFVAYDEPAEILAHLMVGSEGTLGFMSEATMSTGSLIPCTASAMAYFSDMAEACRAVVKLKKSAPEVYSCELLDKKSLASVGDITGSGLTALLIETRAESPLHLDGNIENIEAILSQFKLYKPAKFETDPARIAALWKMRSGVFPTVGATRPMGTTSLIEDIAFPIEHLPEATTDLARIIEECGYADACIYGHAFEGNYHFIIAQAFEKDCDVERYRNLIERIVELVVDKYDGSLKAEHGTGRNMAPFVKKEWGEKAYGLMRRVKDILDPKGLLNPGVIFNDDPECYLRNIKPLPIADPIIDKCIECGFCEVNCVSCGFTLSARQRIATTREIHTLEQTAPNSRRLARLKKGYEYLGEATCAADGLCSLSCPMGINTGDYTHKVRELATPKGSKAYKTGRWAADHLSTIENVLRPMLTVANAAHSVIGDKGVKIVGRVLHKAGAPLWTPSLPVGREKKKPTSPPIQSDLKVVYFPSCINQTMGRSKTKGETAQPHLIETMEKLCAKAGYQVIYPENMEQLCCGMIWESKGMPDIADEMTAKLQAALLKASEGGKYPVLCDQSPCLHRMRQHIKSMPLYEPAEFIADFLAPRLKFHPIKETVAVHVTCSTRQMGLGDKIIELASKCAERVVVPSEIGCCGFAGDRGFNYPELNAWALRKLKPQIQAAGAQHGYSNSRTCEIGLTTHSGIPYQSIAYLVDQATEAGDN